MGREQRRERQRKDEPLSPKAKAGAREQPITEHLGEFLAS